MDESHGIMTVADLRKALGGYPDDLPVFVGVPEGLRIFEGIQLAMFRPTLAVQKPASLTISPTVHKTV